MNSMGDIWVVGLERTVGKEINCGSGKGGKIMKLSAYKTEFKQRKIFSYKGKKVPLYSLLFSITMKTSQSQADHTMGALEILRPKDVLVILAKIELIL